MCGIAGVLSPRPDAAGEAVARAMAASLAPRGPDGAGVRVARGPFGPGGAAWAACLAHTRLAVIDTSAAAAEPLPNEDGAVLLVFNGEVYNHRELRRGLHQRGHAFRSRCDAEVLVHLYEEEGEALCDRLRGMYAFAILDRARGRLLLGRDPAGKKPLYFTEGSEGLAFASDPRALLEGAAAGGPPIERRLDADGLAAYLAVGYVPADRTVLSGIEKLHPGELARFERGRLHRRRGPRFGRPPACGGESLDEATAGLAGWRSFGPARSAGASSRAATAPGPAARAAMAAGGAAQLSMGEAGGLLPGASRPALDASGCAPAGAAGEAALVQGAVASAQRGGAERAAGEGRSPEPTQGRRHLSRRQRVRRVVIEAVAARLESDVPLGVFLSGGIDSTVVAGVARRLAGPLDSFAIGFAEPRWDEAPYAALAAQAIGTRHHERRVTDEAALALPEVVWAHGEPFADESALAMHALAAFARERVTVALTGDGGDELFLGYRHHRVARALAVLDRLVPAALRRRAAAWAPQGGGEKTMRRQVGRLLASVDRPEPERYLTWAGIFPEHGARVAARVAEAGGVEGYDLGVYLPDDLLAKVDRATMAHGLEARCPLLDRRLAALAASLPARCKAPAPWRGKAVLIEAFPELLPPALLRRPKMGFGVPITVWLRREPLRSLARDTLLSAKAQARPWRQAIDAARLLDEHEAGVRDHARRIHALLALELYCLQLLDPPSPTPLRWRSA